ncbi:MAG: hypothetical protein EPN21_10415 [Methylococcaceae bacterium]|nr:MAG: hypothetical protein EPN21_10415 [Methylococcaceae bacterium]
MAIVTERISVLVSANEKVRFAGQARQSGVSLGEFFRRAATAYQAREDDELLEGMVAQMQKTTTQAERAIDDALAFVEASNQRIAAMESRRGG